MKKRIISLILVVVMAVLAFASCGYSYRDDKLTKYAEVDKDKFIEALQSLTIASGDFGYLEDGRWEHVDYTVYSDLAKELGDIVKTTEGKPDQYDLFYYCYYVTVTPEAAEGEEPVTHTVLVTMDALASTLDDVQILPDLEGFDKVLAEAITAEGVDIKDMIYSINKTGKIVGGEKIYVSYTKSTPVFKEDGTPKTDVEGVPVYEESKVAYLEVVVPEILPPTEDDGDEGAEAQETEGEEVPVAVENFLEKLIGQTVGSEIKNKTFEVNEMVENAATPQKVTYSAVTIHWVVEGGSALEVKHTTYEDKKEVKDVYGETVDLANEELTYHIFPVYFSNLPEVDVFYVIKNMYGADLKADTFEAIKTLEIAEELVKEIFEGVPATEEDAAVEGLTSLLKKFSDAKKALYGESSSDSSSSSDSKGAYGAFVKAQEALESAKEALDKAVEEFAPYKAIKDKSDAASEAEETAKKALDGASAEKADAEAALEAARAAVVDPENPTAEETAAIADAEAVLAEKTAAWEAADIALNGEYELDENGDVKLDVNGDPVRTGGAIKDAAAALKAFNDIKTTYNTKKSNNDSAEKKYNTAYDDLYGKVKYEEQEGSDESTPVLDENGNEVREGGKQKAYDDAKAKYDEASAAADAGVERFLALDENLDEEIMKEYKQSVYDSLETSYNASVRSSLLDAIFKLAAEQIKITSYPKEAVKETVESIKDSYVAQFYSSQYDNYKEYDGNYKKFLIATLGLASSSTDKDIDAAIRKEAESRIADRIVVYVLADIFGSAVKVTSKDITEFKKTSNDYKLLINSGVNVEDEIVHTAVQLIKIYDYLLEVDEDAVFDESNPDDKRPVYVNIPNYKFEDEVVEDEEETPDGGEETPDGGEQTPDSGEETPDGGEE